MKCGLLTTFNLFWQLPQGHRVVILTSMERVIKESLTSLDKELAVDIIRLASDEMTKSKVSLLQSIIVSVKHVSMMGLYVMCDVLTCMYIHSFLKLYNFVLINRKR